MDNLIYIGKDYNYLSRFGQLEGIRMIHAKDYQEAIQFYISETRNSRFNLVLFEQGNINEDITNITKFRQKFYQGYLVLITKGLSKEESAHYLHCGINDTIHPDMTTDDFIAKIALIKKRQELLYDNDRKKKEVKHFVLPRWKRIFDVIFSLRICFEMIKKIF